MPPNPDELAERIAKITPADEVRGMIFNGAVECTRQVAGEEAVPRILSSLKDRAKWVDLFTYPAAEYLRLAWAVAEQLESRTGSVESAFFKIGYSSAQSFLSSVVGKTLISLVANEPRKMLSNLPTSYRLATTFGERTYVRKTDTSGTLVFKREFLPVAFHSGCITAALEVAGAKNLKLSSRAVSLLDSEYTLEWE